MRAQRDRGRGAQALGAKLHLALAVAAALLCYGWLSQPLVAGSLAVALGCAGAALLIEARQAHLASRRRDITPILRGGAALALCVLGFFWPLKLENVWLLGGAAVLVEAVVARTMKQIVALVGCALAVAAAAYLLGRFPAERAGTAAVVLSVAAGVGTVLSAYRWREEGLGASGRRLQAVLQCSSALAGSADLRSMILHAVRSGVGETGATGGYVMLLDEEEKSQLVTEVAFSETGEFEFPKSLSVGSGISGYATKMGQPVAVRHEQDGQLELEGTGVGVRAAVSVPLTTRTYRSAGQVSVEHVLGAMTVVGTEPGQTFNEDDMELLSSLGSLVAVAVSNARMEERQRTIFLMTLETLAKSLEARDAYTKGHSSRVCEVSMMIGEHLGLAGEALEELRVGTILHDIGKIGVPDAILNKPGRLTDEEFGTMKSHPAIGYEICRPLGLSDGVLMIIRNHHEKLDGSGYPDGLKGGELPLSLRIVCVADAFDAMSSSRPYRGVMDPRHVLAEISRCAGVQFDPVVVEALRDLMHTYRMIDCYRDQWNQVEGWAPRDARAA